MSLTTFYRKIHESRPALNQNLRHANDSLIGDIERALQRISDGTYGFPDESGAPIPQARLEAMPDAILSVEEQSRRVAGR